MFPVSQGEFHNAQELMLWNPDLNPTSVRIRIALASPWPVVFSGFTAMLAVFSFGRHQWIVGGLGFGMTAASLLLALATYLSFPYEHCHRRDKRCFLDRVPGRFYYRAGNFALLPAAQASTAATIIRTVYDLHTLASVAWVPTHHLRRAHRVAWETLRALDQTRRARTLIVRTLLHAEFADRANALQAEIKKIDEMVDQVSACLLDSRALTRAWDAKIGKLEHRAALNLELAHLTHSSITNAAAMAQDVVEGFFAAVTAARDLLDAGPFEWEHAPLPAMPISAMIPTHNPETEDEPDG